MHGCTTLLLGGLECFAKIYGELVHETDMLLPLQGFRTPTDARHCVNSRSLKFQAK